MTNMHPCAHNTCHGVLSQAFEAAVHRGDIYWHALPFNGQLEFFDVSLLEFAVQLTHELDVKFGLPPKKTMSQVSAQSNTYL